MPQTYQGQLQNGYAPVAGYSNSNPSLPSGTQNTPSLTPTVAAPVPLIPGQTQTVTRYDGQGRPYQVQLPNGFPSGNQTSTTTMGNGNKIDQVPGIVNQTNQYANSSGITTNPQTGQAHYSNGEIYNPPQTNQNEPQQNSGISSGGFVGEAYYPVGAQLPQDASGNFAAVTENSPSDQKIMDSLNQMKAQSDALTASTISSIQSQYQNLIAQQERVNSSQNKSINTSLLMAGSSKYAPISSAGIVQAQMSYGIQQIADLNSKEQQAIIAAQQAGQTQNFKIMDAINNEIATIRNQKIEAATKLNDQLAEQNKKLAEEEKQQTKDTAITDLYSQGIKDVPAILSKLKELGVTASAKDVADTLKNTGVSDINDIMTEASKNGASFGILQKIGQAKTPAEATLLAGEYLGDPLDREYKKAQIAKIYKDLQDTEVSSAFGGDPSQALAYAQQYASTGTIPTGLPKGTFGVISQIAKELPKQKGEVIDANTGVKSSRVSTTIQDDFSTLYNISKSLEQLEELDKKRVGGVVSGTVGAIFGSSDQATYLAKRKGIVDDIQRMQSGAALTESEQEFYKDYLPGRFSETLGLGQDSLKKIKNFKSIVDDKLANKTKSYGLSIYGYSKVETPIGEKTVGETITTPNGLTGRINADGSVTLIQ